MPPSPGLFSRRTLSTLLCCRMCHKALVSPRRRLNLPSSTNLPHPTVARRPKEIGNRVNWPPGKAARLPLATSGRRTLIFLRWTAALLFPLSLCVPAQATGHLQRFSLELRRVNRQIKGQVLDYTDNHGHDRRLYSTAL